jgi:hypothetical protein
MLETVGWFWGAELNYESLPEHRVMTSYNRYGQHLTDFFLQYDVESGYATVFDSVTKSALYYLFVIGEKESPAWKINYLDLTKPRVYHYSRERRWCDMEVEKIVQSKETMYVYLCYPQTFSEVALICKKLDLNPEAARRREAEKRRERRKHFFETASDRKREEENELVSGFGQMNLSMNTGDSRGSNEEHGSNPRDKAMRIVTTVRPGLRPEQTESIITSFFDKYNISSVDLAINANSQRVIAFLSLQVDIINWIFGHLNTNIHLQGYSREGMELVSTSRHGYVRLATRIALDYNGNTYTIRNPVADESSGFFKQLFVDHILGDFGENRPETSYSKTIYLWYDNLLPRLNNTMSITADLTLQFSPAFFAWLRTFMDDVIHVIDAISTFDRANTRREGGVQVHDLGRQWVCY